MTVSLVVIALALVVTTVLLGLIYWNGATSTGDFYFDVAAGKRPGMQALTISGRNPSVSTSANEDLWEGGGDFPPPLGYAQAVEVASDSVEDAPGQDGALTVTLEGVGEGYISLRESVALKGTEAVLTSSKFLAVNSMYVASSGAYGVNRGEITATAQEARSRMAIVMGSLVKSHAARYTVPANETVMINHLTANINQPGDDPVTTAMFILWVQNAEEGGNTKPVTMFGVQASGDGHMKRDFAPPIKVPPRSEIYMSVSVSTCNVDVSADIEAVVVKDTNY